MVSGATQTALDYASRLCLTPSYNNVFNILEDLSEDEARKVKVIGRDPERGLDLTFDNVQTYAKRWEARIGRESVMKVGMAGTAGSFPPGIEEVNLVYTKQAYPSAERCIVDQLLQVFGYQLLG